MMSNRSGWYSKAVATAGLLLLWYTVYRACRVSFTFDELGSLSACKDSVLDIMLMRTWVDANNHLLNILLIKACRLLPFDALVVYRLPNLVAHVFFMFFSYVLLRKFTSGGCLLLAGFILLNCNPYTLDFFMLARGYGLANCCTLIAFYFLLELYHDRGEPLYDIQVACMAFGALGALANFSYVYYYTAFFILTAVRNLMLFRTEVGTIGIRRWSPAFFVQSFYVNFIPILSIIALAVCMYIPVTKLISFKKLFFGGTAGFWQDSVLSVMERTFYGRLYVDGQVLYAGIAAACLLFAGCVVSVLCIRRLVAGRHAPPKACTGLILSLAMLGIVFCLTTVNFYFFGTRFLIQRTAQFIIILIILVSVFLFDTVLGMVRASLVVACTRALLCFFVLAYVANACAAFNTRYVLDWKFDAETPALINDLREFVPAGGRLKVGGTWRFAPAFRFYADHMSTSGWLEEYQALNDYSLLRTGSDTTALQRYTEEVCGLDMLYVQNIHAGILERVEGVEPIRDYSLAGARLYRVQCK